MGWGPPPELDLAQWETSGLEGFAFSDVKRLVSSDSAFVSFFEEHSDAWLERIQHLRVEEPKSQAYRWEIAWHNPNQRLSFVLERRCYEDATMQLMYGDCVNYWGSGEAVGQESGSQGEVHESDPRRPPLNRSATMQEAVQTAILFTNGSVPPLIRWTARATFSDEVPADFDQPSLPVFYFGVGEVHRTPSYTPDVKHDARGPSLDVRMVRMSHSGWLLNPFPEPSSD